MMNGTPYQYINLEYMDLMSDGDPDMKNTMLEMLLEELPAELGKMRSLLDDGNYDELSQVSHKMKSTLAFVGNPSMTEANKKLELWAKKEENIDQIPGLMETLENLQDNVIDELQNAIKN